MFINVGAYVDEGTMVDSHALVGSCAQIGKRVHLSAAAQIGGVLEPVNAAPVIIEDDVLVGGNCGVYEGTLVRSRAVLGAGTILTRSTPLYDLVRGEVYRATAEKPLEVPENAVVVPGSRAVKKGLRPEWNLSLYTPVIVKYRDEKTDWKNGCGSSDVRPGEPNWLRHLTGYVLVIPMAFIPPAWAARMPAGASSITRHSAGFIPSNLAPIR
jgi:2,3,4,5-tetrahydropyridine-2,6-dicarboxylate N-succinyltransferase